MPVASVEAVYGETGSIGLLFRYSDEAQLVRWTSLDWIGSTLDLEGGEDPRCPFFPEDDVVYTPTDRGRALVLHTGYAGLVPNQCYRVARIDRDVFVVPEGFELATGGGVYWTEFSRRAG
jgi:hypothetical protein